MNEQRSEPMGRELEDKKLLNLAAQILLNLAEMEYLKDKMANYKKRLTLLIVCTVIVTTAVFGTVMLMSWGIL